MLSNPQNAVLGELDTAICTIRNDDPAFTSPGIINQHTTDQQKIKIYPNPATDVVTITLTDNAEGAQLELLNACGQLVRSWQPETTTGYLPIYNLPNGIYYLRLSTGDGSKATGKLVVLHP